jgi:Domain of unknown function (DUF397)
MTKTWCSAGDCITVTESTEHPGVIHIGTRHDGEPGRVQLTVTRGEWEAFVAGIKAEERDRIHQLARRSGARYSRRCIDGSCPHASHYLPFADLLAGDPS